MTAMAMVKKLLKVTTNQHQQTAMMLADHRQQCSTASHEATATAR